MRPKTLSNRLNQVLIAVLTIVALAMGQSAWADNINISANATDLALTNGNTYTVTANVTITNRIIVTGTVNLVLGDGTTLHAPKGIHVSEGNTLTISGTGALTIDETAYKYAGIGVSDQDNCGTVNITGGVINIQVGKNAYGIGTAANSSARCGDITITGGQVTVTSGSASSSASDDRYYAIGGSYGYGSLTLGWTNTTDYIVLNSGCNGLASFSLVDGRELYIEAENGGKNLLATWDRINRRDKGFTLKPLTDQFNRNIEVSSINDFPQKYAYTGEAFDVNYIVKDVLGTTLTKGTDYTETFSPSTVKNTGDYTLTVTGTGSATSGYYGSHDVSFAVTSDLIQEETGGQKYIRMGQQIPNDTVIYGVVWPSTGLNSLKIYHYPDNNGNIAVWSRSHLILTAPLGYVIQLDGDVSVFYEDVSVYDGCGTSNKRLFKADKATGSTQVTSSVSLHSNGRMMMIEVASGNNPNRGSGLNLTATLRKATDLTISNIIIPAYFSRNNGNPINITYSVNAAGLQLEEDVQYTKTIKKVGTTTALDEVTEIGKYELTITAKEGSGYTGSNSTTFYVCEGIMMTNAIKTWENNTYSVIEDVTFGSRINVSGDVKLILWENATLNVSGRGIELNNNNKLTIDGEGTLNVSSYDAAAIGPSSGSELSMGTLVIDGGTVNATITMSSGYIPAAIGTSKDNVSGGSITINGGVVNATSGKAGYAAIGGYSSCCDITINGGQVTASGIGCSPYSSANSGSLTLGWTNPTDFVKSGNYNGLASITFAKHFRLDETDIVANMGNIVNKKIVPISEEATKDFASAVVYGMNTYYGYTGSEIEINYNVEDAFGHRLREGVDYTAEISPATVKEKGTYTLTLTPKAGSGYTGTWTKTFQVKDKVTVTGSTTTMTNNIYYVPSSGSSVTIDGRITISGDVVLDIADGATLKAKKGFELSEGNMLTIQGGGKLVINECESSKSGIGSAGQVGTLIVNGGDIDVKGGSSAAGIGCDNNTDIVGVAGTVIINGGIVNATSDSDSRAGIGASYSSLTGGNIIINGGQVTATLWPSCGTVTLGWTKGSDFVILYMTEKMHVIFAEGKSFLVEETGTEVTTTNIYGTDVRGKKLVPKPDACYLDFATLTDPPTINWYTGNVINYTVKDYDGNTLTEGQDYTVSMIRKRASETDSPTELQKVGIYALTVKGIGNYMGSNTYKVIISSGQELYREGAGNAYGPGYNYMKDEICIIAKGEEFASNYENVEIKGDVMIVLEDGSRYMPKGLIINKGNTLIIDIRGNGTGRMDPGSSYAVKGGDDGMGTLIINGGGIDFPGGIGKTNGMGGKVVLNLTNINSYVDTKWGSDLASITIPDGVTLTDDDKNTYNSQTDKSVFTSWSGTKKLYPTLPPTLTLTANPGTTGAALETIYWTTFYSSDAGYRIDNNQNACAYTATTFDVNDSNKKALRMHKLGRVIPIGTPVIVVGDTETINMTVSDAVAENNVGNDLKGTNVRIHTDDVPGGQNNVPVYVLSKSGSIVGFYKYRGILPPHRAYLQLPANSLVHSFEFMFDDDETDIIDVRGEMSESRDDIYYDLNGRRVLNPTKGLYIKNGKKVIK
jgi:hypothetical protein